MKKRISSISVIGLGKLGSPMAAMFAAKGYRVVGTDVDIEKVKHINAGLAPVFEPQLQEFIDESKGRLSASQDTRQAVLDTDISFVIVPTPSEEGGGFSLKHILPACESIGLALRAKSDYHIVVITSTVMPGATGGAIKDTLEEVSGKRCGVDFGLCYSPEFIALGSVIHNYLHPDFVLVGESDETAGATLESIYKRVCQNDPPVARMNWVNAELTKISVNSFITTKITYANTLARICESIPGANVDTVTQALGLDDRIGPKYLKGAVGYGGPCFPRDNRAVARLAADAQVDAALARTTDDQNNAQTLHLAEKVAKLAGQGARVGVLGLAYKPDTDVVFESQGVFLATNLAKRGIEVTAYDPHATQCAIEMVDRSGLNGERKNVRFAESLDECLGECDVIVVMLPTDEFRNIDFSHAASRVKTVVDCWRIYRAQEVEPYADYVALGVGPVPQNESDSEAVPVKMV